MKRHLWTICFSAILVVFSAYLALDTFVLSTSYGSSAGEANTAMFAENDTEDSAAVIAAETGNSETSSSRSPGNRRARTGTDSSSDCRPL